ncbi:DMT family transporter [Rheinheimera tangshanensis]|uniref:DMT family transporter n=1 Tax=Rheinheimera tangshanensis TaxID=400153 RepID=A0A5C8LKC8_9GAMM|nr:DMT family transporter [Rheinheimera tangshanensis]MBP8227942.1 DMT family transporter [Rheinheimera sp.]TXK77801.1 DMT family transporter [Rheinheimera tangshanensis]GGM63792.1 transporter [Rheinheimera tangshanensis]
MSVVSASPQDQSSLSFWQKPLMQGLWFGSLGMLMFSAGLPATRMAVLDMPPVFVGAGRALIAALLALILLLVTRQKLPSAKQWYGLSLVALGSVFAYPVLSALALQQVGASHGILVTSVMPLFTAFFGAYLTKQWPRIGFWLFALLGAACVALYALQHSTGPFQLADGYLVLASFLCGFSYAKGAILSKELGSWQVICWALVMSIPVLLPWVWAYQPDYAAVSLQSWLALGYLSVFTMFIGFFCWYKGLAIGGIAKVSQLQLLSPFSGLVLSALLLAEPLQWIHWILALTVVGCIALGRRFG